MLPGPTRALWVELCFVLPLPPANPQLGALTVLTGGERWEETRLLPDFLFQVVLLLDAVQV